MKTRSMYKAERLSVDRISTLPQPIIETILCLLPTEEAARTSILSREWRYKWTTIPKLWFELSNTTSEVELTSDTANAMKYMDMYVIYQVLLLRQGPIHKLDIVLEDYWEHYDCSEFELIMLHLSRKHIVKELRLNGLDLEDMCLGTLELSYVKVSTQTLLLLLSNCPSLKKLSLDIVEPGDKCTINELLKCLPVIEDLNVSGGVSEWLVPDSVPQERPISLIHLKYLSLNQMCLTDGWKLAFVLELFKCSPNLEHARLEIEWGLKEFSAVKDKYSDIWLEHLNRLSICFPSSWLDTEFVKFILARSPKLKEVSILVVDQKQESKMLKTLKRAPRASSGVKITTWSKKRSLLF
ncbi:hypothetical protein M8C21_005492 [Ambrosia artemisiifolia]|uniref:F-box domain-containing protein n=1 Tax=Ambrosia artemisiifolia TaxID=4212 RepID=A0AAD5BMJ6_AMBAR|nr:hypothetical protein M8C21_005492 [Ambrosia artemisiifolia]